MACRAMSSFVLIMMRAMNTSVSKSTASIPKGSERATAVSFRPRHTKAMMKKVGTDMITADSTMAYLHTRRQGGQGAGG